MGEASLERDEPMPNALPDMGEASLDRSLSVVSLDEAEDSQAPKEQSKSIQPLKKQRFTDEEEATALRDKIAALKKIVAARTVLGSYTLKDSFKF